MEKWLHAQVLPPSGQKSDKNPNAYKFKKYKFQTQEM